MSPRLHSPWSIRSCRRPGVAMTMSTRAAQLVDLPTHGGAAVDREQLEVERLTQRGEGVVRPAARARGSGPARGRAGGRPYGCHRRGGPAAADRSRGSCRSRSGARPRTSRPVRASGMERVWMAKGAVMPRRSRAVTILAGRPMDAKVASSIGSAAALSAAASSASSRSDLGGAGGGDLGPLRRPCEPPRGPREDELRCGEPPREEDVRAERSGPGMSQVLRKCCGAGAA